MDQEHKRLELISRIVIFIPLIIVVVSVLMKSNSPTKAILSEQITPSVVLNQSETKTSSKAPLMNKHNVSLDLYGPYRCEYKKDSTDITVAVKNKNISVSYVNGKTTTNVVITDECGYKWDEGTFTGEKMCNIGQYISIVEMLSSFNILKFDSILSMINQVDPSISVDPAIVTSITDTCKKEEIDSTVFTVPTTISFSDIQSVTPQVQ